MLALIDAHPEQLRLLPTVGATAGLREGELCGLALEDFDFDEKLIRVRRQVKKIGPAYIFCLPKNSRTRVVPLAYWLAQTIRVHVGRHKPLPCTLPWESQAGRRARTTCWCGGSMVGT